ncbi:MAG: S8 family serine peptidase, partial [candidate division WOR-3 bacterium]
MRFVLKILLPVCFVFGPGMALVPDHYDMGPAYVFSPEQGDEVNTISFSNGFTADTRTGESRVPEHLRASEDAAGERYRIVQFIGPIRQDWLRALRRLGVEPFGYLPHYAVLAKLGPEQLARVRKLPMVNWTGLFHPGYKVQELLLHAYGRPEIVIQVTPGESAEPVLSRVQELGGLVGHVTESDFGTTVRATVDAVSIAELARMPEVIWIQEWTEPRVANDDCQWVTQTGWRSSAPPPTDTIARHVWTRGVRGQRVIMSTTDTGLNHIHNQFRDTSLSITPPGIWPGHRKIVAFKLMQGPGGTAHQGESPRHGTHVNGTVAGNDSVFGDSSFYDGMAKDGRLYFVDLTTSSGGFVIGTNLWALWDTVYAGRGLPDSLRPIKQHSGSWRWYNSQGTYLVQDASTDAFCWVNKDFMNIMAAGNESSGRRIGNPAIAKNVLTVGATGNGTSSNTIASFSSRGPTQDNRIKPTVMAPGVSLYSARMYPATNTYEALSGTSMATPATNGTVGLMRCYLQEGFYPTGTPVSANRIGYISSALLRSMAVASADPNIGSYVPPSFDMGWGRVDADSVLYLAGDSRKLMLKDDTSGVSTGQYKEAVFYVDSAMPLRVALAWTDTAAAPNANPTLVNDLNLEVTSPGGTYFRGNQYTSGQSTPNPTAWDTLNVEECVRVNSPSTGTWRIRVYGQQVATAARQPFAYTITGGLVLDVDDVGVSALVAPSGTVDSGTVVTPACSVYNYGNRTVSYPVQMRIGTGYSQTQTVTGHAPGNSEYVSFPSWTAGPRGAHPVACSTRLSTDLDDTNDKDTGTVTVAVRDVGATRILAPAGTVDSGTVVTPACSVYNHGTATESYLVRMRIGTGYDNTASVSGHAAGTAQYVVFPSWTAGTR